MSSWKNNSNLPSSQSTYFQNHFLQQSIFAQKDIEKKPRKLSIQVDISQPQKRSPNRLNINLQMFSSLKNLVKQLQLNKNSNNQKFNDEFLEKQIEQAKIITSLNHQIFYLKQAMTNQEKKMQINEQNFEKTIKQNQNKHRKQIKKYIDLLNEKQIQIQNQKKTIKSLNNRSVNLSNQIQMLNSAKTNLQNMVLKSIEGVKSSLKQFNYSLQQNELDKVVLQTKYKQLCDKIEQVVRQSHQWENNKNKIQKKYQKLKESYQLSRNQCTQLKFQVERYKIKVKDLNDIIQGRNKGCIVNQQKHNFSQSHQSRQNLLQIKQKIMQIVQNMKSLNEKRDSLKQLDIFRIKLDQFIKQNDALKLKIYQLQQQNDNLNLKIQGNSYEDQILKNRIPSTYQLLLQKKQNIEKFERKIEQIQRIAFQAQYLMKKKYQSVQNNQTVNQSTNLHIIEEENRIRTKIYEDLSKQFELTKQKLLIKQKQINQKAKQKERILIKQLEDTILSLRKQNQKYKNVIQSLQKERKRLKSMLEEIMEQNHPKKKKNGKTKPKLRCFVCLKQFSTNSKAQKCAQCCRKMHIQCIKSHDCHQKVDEFTDSESNDYSYG